ncbi:carbohydrate-binding protein [Gayadomonas joobiniege]|uniref:carbohydrate-binding protein n=1 Tax=Gayadomonas joobiniege TaxID=1234606 RepID=UPI0003685362|nr:carbohydrate-binding protein [Gayadomonas joobiniege]
MFLLKSLLKANIYCVCFVAFISGCASTSEPTKPNNPITVHATSFTDTNKAKIEKQQKSVGYIKDGTYLTFEQVQLGEEKNSIEIAAATPTQGGTVEVRLGDSQGEIIANLKINKTGKWYNWQTFSGRLNKPIKGQQKITLVFTSGKNWLFNIQSITFKNSPGN